MYELLAPGCRPESAIRPANIAYHRIFDTVKETGGLRFLHGVALESWQGRLMTCFALNDNAENSITERLVTRSSDDGGLHWSPLQTVSQQRAHANSHSVFCVHEGVLWCFGPRFDGLGAPPITKSGHTRIHFLNLRMEAWRFQNETWQEMGLVGGDFWPLGAPEPMGNGNWLIAGCDEQWRAAFAISHGDDFTQWEIARPDIGEEVFTEAGAWVRGNCVFAIMRNQSIVSEGKYCAAITCSYDYGKTFASCEISNLPMATTKPFCGRFHDGRPYLIFNESISGKPHDRGRLILGICNTKEFCIDQVWLIDEGSHAASGRQLSLSYPYAKQLGNLLYVAYSYESMPGAGYSQNDAMLAVIPVADLT